MYRNTTYIEADPTSPHTPYEPPIQRIPKQKTNYPRTPRHLRPLHNHMDSFCEQGSAITEISTIIATRFNQSAKSSHT